MNKRMFFVIALAVMAILAALILSCTHRGWLILP